MGCDGTNCEASVLNELHLRNQAQAFYRTVVGPTKRQLDQQLAAIRDNPLPDGNLIASRSPDLDGQMQYTYTHGPWLITFGIQTDRPDLRFNVIVTGIIHYP